MQKKKLITIIIALVLTVAIAGGVVAGLLTNWFGLALGPARKFLLAADKTVATKNVTITLDDEYSSTEFVYSKVGNKTAFSYDDGAKVLYYNGMAYYIREDEDGIRASSYESEEMEIIFDAIDDYNKGKDIDWDELVEVLYLDEFIDADQVDDFIKLAFKKLRDREWLEDIFNFEIDGNTLHLSMKADEAFLEFLEVGDDADLFECSVRELKEEAEWMEDITIDIDVEIEKGRIAVIDVSVDEGDDNPYEFNIEFSDYGDSEIDKDDINDFIDEVEENEHDYDYYY